MCNSIKNLIQQSKIDYTIINESNNNNTNSSRPIINNKKKHSEPALQINLNKPNNQHLFKQVERNPSPTDPCTYYGFPSSNLSISS